MSDFSDGVTVEEMVSLAPLTSLGVGGKARYFARFSDVDELKELFEFAAQKSLPMFVLGGGTNILLSDGVLEKLVIKNELKGIEYSGEDSSEVKVTVAAGEHWDNFVADVAAKGLFGVENLSGVPGTVGAAPVQNINCYGVSITDVIESVRVYDVTKGTEREFSNEECLFGYRDSIFKHSAGADLIVTAVTIKLTKNAPTKLAYRSSSQSIESYLKQNNIVNKTPADIREAVLFVRKNIGMLEGCFRSAGSFFKNTIVSEETFLSVQKKVADSFSEQDAKLSPWHWPLENGEVKISTAFLLECTAYNKNSYGKKRLNNVGLSPLHSLSVVTEEGATANDVHAFVEKIVSAVDDTFGLVIESEVVVVK